MKCDVLNWDLLVRSVDEELSEEEDTLVTAHIEQCRECQREIAAIKGVSRQLESVVNSAPVLQHAHDREQFVVKPIRQAPEKVMRRFGWGMAIAASLALGIIIAPKPKPQVSESTSLARVVPGASGAIEVDGESFITLPYSNPDLPSVAPRIVQMEVPISSLADIGISLEPISSQANQDRSVLADVLLGADGQPLGVHVVSWE